MSRKGKQTQSNTQTQSNREVIRAFKDKVEGLAKKGYMPLHRPSTHVIYDEVGKAGMSESLGGIGGGLSQKAVEMFDMQDPQPISTPKGKNGEEIGTPGLRYIPWGLRGDDRLPLYIYQAERALPYTSSAFRFLVDLTVGLGPQYMYKWVCISTGGVLSEKLIPFEHAGYLLRYKIQKLKEALNSPEDPSAPNPQPLSPVGQGEYNPTGEKSSEMRTDEHTIVLGENATYTETTPLPLGGGREVGLYRVKSADPLKTDPMQLEPSTELGTNEDELRRTEREYELWEQTMGEVAQFIEHNNLTDHFLRYTNDDWHLDIAFPTVGLNMGKVGSWDAKIVSIGLIPAVCARFEEKDLFGNSNYTYYSENWRRFTRNTLPIAWNEMVAYPNLRQQDMVGDLQRYVGANQHTPIKKRQLWFCVPSQYPSCFTPYYPQPAWWSIFQSMVYQYATTLMFDKSIARQNAIMWGKMVFIDKDWLTSLEEAEGATDDAAKDKIREDIIADVNDFLMRRENSGKTITSDKYTDERGNEHKAIEIVDVPQLNSAATKDELEEISSIIFFAIGVDPRLIGAVPGKAQSSSGTQARELYLLKQIQVSPRQRQYLYFLNSIAIFNKWSRHGVWTIGKEVLSTLDRSATGIVETE